MDTIKQVLIGARITEKAALASEKNVYVFNVATDATKNEIKKEIKRIYKVDPIKVNTVNIKGKKTFIRGKKGSKSDARKAYVFLKDGDSINVI
jgi:large subunit ribosomal protein L23